MDAERTNEYPIYHGSNYTGFYNELILCHAANALDDSNKSG